MHSTNGWPFLCTFLILRIQYFTMSFRGTHCSSDSDDSHSGRERVYAEDLSEGEDNDVIDGAIRPAMKEIGFYRFQEERRKRLMKSPFKFPKLSEEDSLIYEVAQRELDAEDYQFKVTCGLRPDDLPFSPGVTPKQRFFERRGINALAAATVVEEAKLHSDLAKNCHEQAIAAKRAAHRRYADCDVSLQCIKRWQMQHRLDVCEIIHQAEEFGADIEVIARAQEEDAANVVQVLSSQLRVVMAPTHRVWFYSNGEHVSLRRAIGLSESN
jgi:hypothetical protein